MKKFRFLSIFPCFFFLFLFLSLSSCANGMITFSHYEEAERYLAGEVSYSPDVTIEEINIEWVVGDIVVSQSQDQSFSLQESSQSLEEDKKVHTWLDGTLLHVEFWKSGLVSAVKASEKNLTLSIPSSVSLNISSVSGSVQISSLEVKSLHLSTVSGEISLEEMKVKNEINLSSVSGAIEAKQVESPIFAVDNVSGKVVGEGLKTPRVDVDSTSGKVDLEFLQCEQANIDTVSSSVYLTLPEGGASIYFDTMSGKLHSKKEYVVSGEVYRFQEGLCQIQVDTVSGDLTVR